MISARSTDFVVLVELAASGGLLKRGAKNCRAIFIIFVYAQTRHVYNQYSGQQPISNEGYLKMYLPLTGADPDRDRTQKMKISFPPPISPQQTVQPAGAAAQTDQRAEGVSNEKINPTQSSDDHENKPSLVEQQHYAAPSLSTQDFMALKATTAPESQDDNFAALDEVIARFKEQIDAAGDFMEAIREMNEKTNPDVIALQVLTKTLEAMDETREEK
jgi:hypothetical protein